MILGTPKDAFKWDAELSENAWQMCYLGYSKVTRSFALRGTENTFPVCAARRREMKGAGGVAGNNSGTAGFTYCPAGASAGRRTTASETSCCLGFLIINPGKEGPFESAGTAGGQRPYVQGQEDLVFERKDITEKMLFLNVV